MPLRYELHRYSPFTFCPGVDETIQHLVERVEHGHRLLVPVDHKPRVVGPCEFGEGLAEGLIDSLRSGAPSSPPA